MIDLYFRTSSWVNVLSYIVLDYTAGDLQLLQLIRRNEK